MFRRPHTEAARWLAACLGWLALTATAADLEFFETRIRPVLAEHCYPCHSAGAEKLKGQFHADSREGIRRGGESRLPAIVPGDVAASRLLTALRWTDPEFQMPPKQKLSDAQIADFTTWVKAGAADPREENPTTKTKRAMTSAEAKDYWAFQPLSSPPVPKLQATAASARTPIDRFIFAKLEEKGLRPSSPADRRKLLRRAAFALTGLPPAPDDFTALELDRSPDAFARAVDRLLASPHYGERWARHWLDVARFAESSGFEHDYDRPNAWHYRDYVIRAFNADQPYDEFVRWQLAGDEFAPADPLALMATGFLGAGVFPTQITANEVERARYDALDDMASTTGAAFLGLSVGCARCHDHKFDPIATRDYYRFIATFTTTVRSHVELNLEPEDNAARLKAWEHRHAEVVAERDRYEHDRLAARFNEWLAANPRIVPPPWLVLDFTEAKSAGGATLTPQADGSLLASGKSPDFDRYTFVAKVPLRDLAALRVEALADKSFPKSGPGRADNGNFALSDVQVTARPLGSTNPPTAVKLVRPRATFEQKGLPVAAAIDADAKSGWAVDPEFGKDHAAVFEFEQTVGGEEGVELSVTLKFDTNNRHSIGRPRLSVAVREAMLPIGTGVTNASPDFFAASASAKSIAEVTAALAAPSSQRSAAQVAALRDWHRRTDADWRKLDAAVAASLAGKPKPKLATVMVASEGLEPIRMHTQGADFFEQTFFLKRGDVNQKGDAVAAGFLPVIMRQPETRWQQTRPAGQRTSYRRRALADWITDPRDGAGPLLARVMVNRVWAAHFGRGLVATPNDFGLQGEPPTHPELLEWLADEFVRSGWSMKSLHRLILDSAVWQQSGTGGGEVSEPVSERTVPTRPPSLPLSHSLTHSLTHSPTGSLAHPPTATPATELDPGNRLLHHFPRHRLEAETIRDNLLAVSGTLDPRMGGPGTLDEGHLRRSVYFTVKRSQLSRTLQLFDAPDAVLSAGNRPATITAPQALMFLNSPFVRARARDFAQRLLPEAKVSPAEAVRRGYESTVGRLPTPDETADSVAFLTQQADAYRDHDAAGALGLALEDFCQVLFGLNEFVYVD